MTVRPRFRRLLGWAAAALLAVTVGPAVPASAETVISPPSVTPATPIFVAGTPVTFTFTAYPHGETPVAYRYRLNDGDPVQVDAVGGHASVPLTFFRRTNFLRVQAVAADDTRSSEFFNIYHARAASPAADHDLTGDGVPDLLTVGGTIGLGSGLWQAAGQSAPGAGQVDIPATNIGIKGNGVTGQNAPADFDGAQVITGKFLWSGWEEMLVYYPGGTSQGLGVIISGEGDGSALQPQLSGNGLNIDAQSLQDPYGNSPLRLANGYDADGVEPLAPDLISVTGDPVNGYGLTYHPSMPLNGVYYGNYRLTTTTPSGGTDWQNWSIASTRVASGVALFLRNQATGALYLWQGVTVADNGTGTGTLTRTQFEIAANWRTGEALTTLQATDIDGDGVPDLWAVTPDGTATAYLISGLNPGATATVQAQPAQSLA